MNVVAGILTAVLGIVLIGVGYLEAFRYRDQRWFSMFRIRPEDADTVRLWVVNLGFYNIVYGLGALGAVALSLAGQPTAGVAIAAFVALSHVVLAGVLLAVDRRLWRNSVYEAVVPIAVLVALPF